MKIGIVGWGSLIWNPAGLPHDGDWRTGGPPLPIEFSRISPDGRLTLIIDPVHGRRTFTRWTTSSRNSVADAVSDLAAREKCDADGIGFINLVTGERSRQRFPEQIDVGSAISTWCVRQTLDGVLWTALPSTFEAQTGNPFSVDNGLSYLDSLNGALRATALQYIRNAPQQVATPLRQAFGVDPRFS